MQKYQSRAARVITGATFDTRTADVFLTLSWENLDARRDFLKSICIYKLLNNLTALNLNRLLIRTIDRSISYNLRQSNTNLVLPIPKFSIWYFIIGMLYLIKQKSNKIDLV